jgi:hypothetical protein
MTREFIYNEKVVEFFHTDHLMVNATEMASIFNAKTIDFLKLESTKKWIKWLENTPIRAKRSGDSQLRSSANGLFPGEVKYKSADLVPILTIQKDGDNSGCTWMHHMLATDFAMWLDIDFKGWVIMKVNELLFNYTFEKRQLEIEKVTLQNKLKRINETESAKNPVVREIFETLKRLDQNKGDAFNLNKSFKQDLFNN